MAFIRIEDVRDIPATTIARAGKMDKQVIYSVDASRRYSLTMPAEDYTVEKALQKIKDAETERAKMIGQSFTI